VLYLYAITEADSHPDVAGLDGAPVGTICVGTVAAIASEHAELRLEPAEEELWAHETVVEAAMDDGPVLPMRIGSVVEDTGAVVAMLRARGSDFGRALDHVRGAVEIGVRAAVDPAGMPSEAPVDPDGDAPGTAYLLSRLTRKRRLEDIGSRIDTALRELARDHKRLSASPERMTLNAAYLVADDRVDEFIQRAAALQEETGATVVCTGPWPPYSFTPGNRS
jgi:hypothetical protein